MSDEALENFQQIDSMETNATSLNASAEAEMSLPCLPDVRGAVRRGWWRLQELFLQCQRIPESGLSETGEIAGGEYKPLNHEQREKLGEFFQHIISEAAVDYTKLEMQDIRYAVDTMLERIETRVNSRGIFKIARIVPGGSMAEKTAIWKFTEAQLRNVYNQRGTYLEFDFLAILENEIEQYENPCLRKRCQGCIAIVKSPMELERLRQYHNGEDEFSPYNLGDKEVISKHFLKEINHCLTSSCDCLSIHSDIYPHIFRPSSVEHTLGCKLCTVDRPTGTLRVNTEININPATDESSNCSLIFHWTSKRKTLSAPDKKLLQEPQPISSLPIFVDFLPALESLKPTPSGAGGEHDYFIVPKRCHVHPYGEWLQEPQPISSVPIFVDFCPALESLKPTPSGAGGEHDFFIVRKRCNVCSSLYCFHYSDRWRKSWCMAEIHAFTKMSDKHRRCYQIMKFLSGIFYTISNYHVKTVLLRHHTTCSDTTDECVDCVLGMFRDLLQAYKTKELLSYQSNLNLLQEKDFTGFQVSDCETLIECMYSTDTWRTFIRKALFNSSVR